MVEALAVVPAVVDEPDETVVGDADLVVDALEQAVRAAPRARALPAILMAVVGAKDSTLTFLMARK